MKLEVFDVGHGACALVTTGDMHLMIDCASSNEFDFFPGDLLAQRGIDLLDLLIITNYDEDHARGLPNLLLKTKVGRFKVNRKVQPDVIDNLKGFKPGAGIAAAINMAKRYNNYNIAPLVFPDVSYKTYSHAYPRFEDENNLSLVVALKIGGVNFIFPGDMECEGWEALLDDNQGLEEDLKKAHVFIAPHHGRISGICDRIFDECKCSPKLVIISDKAYNFDTQATIPYYRSKVTGGWQFRGNQRHVLTTRKDGKISFEITRLASGKSQMQVF